MLEGVERQVCVNSRVSSVEYPQVLRQGIDKYPERRNNLIILKLGGSVLTPEKLVYIPKLVSELLRGYKLVIVVSAISRYPYPYATDTLLKLIGNGEARGVNPIVRDFLLYTGEMIASALVAYYLELNDIPAQPLTGFQAGITLERTPQGYGRVISVKPFKVLELLDSGKVPVICGFQGMSTNGELITMDRGGSDVTAVAIAVTLNAERVLLVKDVPGVLSADPKIVSEPVIHKAVSYEELGELTYNGSKLVHPDAVSLAQQAKIKLRISSLEGLRTGMGTEVWERSGVETMLTAITLKDNLNWFRVRLNNPEITERMLTQLAEHNISLDFISLYQGRHRITLSFTVDDKLADLVKSVLRNLKIPSISDGGYVKVSIIGPGIRGKPGIFRRIFAVLKRENIIPIQVSDSHISISMLLKAEHGLKAVRSLHDEFFRKT